jgi:hypothetical protein
LSSLNHFTVPVAMYSPSELLGEHVGGLMAPDQTPEK